MIVRIIHANGILTRPNPSLANMVRFVDLRSLTIIVKYALLLHNPDIVSLRGSSIIVNHLAWR